MSSVTCRSLIRLDQQLSESKAIFSRRFPMILCGVFAAAALALTLVAPYAVCTHEVLTRRRELGIRLALGGSPGSIRRSILSDVILLGTAGISIGAIVAMGVSRGRAASSIFLSREFSVRVWATDPWFSASENQQRVADAGLEGEVFPIHADARSLPFAAQTFDAVVSIESFPYYGTDDLYLSYLARFVKPEGRIGIAGAGQMQEIEGPPSEHLRAWWEPSLCCLHSPAWWRRHWERSGIATVDVADALPDGWKYWLDWQRVICPENVTELETVQADSGRFLGYVRTAAHRRVDVKLDELIVSIPPEYSAQPLLRAK